MDKHRLDEQRAAYQPTFRFHDENEQMLAWYSRRVLTALRPRSIESGISLGIGQKIVCKTLWEALQSSLRTYYVVEGSTQAVDELKREGPVPPNVRLTNCLFEDFEPGEQVDAVEMGFVLEHVDHPLSVLEKAVRWLKPGGLAVLAVPNARSLHRLVGFEAGLLDNVYRLSQADLALGHKRYFDMESVIKLVLAAGLRILAIEGVFLKILTTAQLASLRLDPAVTDALFRVGVRYPEIANAIYLEATP